MFIPSKLQLRALTYINESPYGEPEVAWFDEEFAEDNAPALRETLANRGLVQVVNADGFDRLLLTFLGKKTLQEVCG